MKTSQLKIILKKGSICTQEKADTCSQKKDRLKERQPERKESFISLGLSCIADVLRSCGPQMLSHVVPRDASLSHTGLLHCHTVSLVPSNMRLQRLALMLKLKSNSEEGNYPSTKKCLRISTATNCQCFS